MPRRRGSRANGGSHNIIDYDIEFDIYDQDTLGNDISDSDASKSSGFFVNAIENFEFIDLRIMTQSYSFEIAPNSGVSIYYLIYDEDTIIEDTLNGDETLLEEELNEQQYLYGTDFEAIPNVSLKTELREADNIGTFIDFTFVDANGDNINFASQMNNEQACQDITGNGCVSDDSLNGAISTVSLKVKNNNGQYLFDFLEPDDHKDKLYNAVNSLDFIIEHNLLAYAFEQAGEINSIQAINPALNQINGNNFSNSLLGTLEEDDIYGYGGNDTLIGGGGEDSLYGNDGNDSLTGGIDDDTLLGGDGNDLLDGGSGNDWLDGGDGNDSLIGAGGTDTLIGGNGDDSLRSNFVFSLTPDYLGDSLDGGAGNDRAFGQSGDDTIYGGIGNDVLFGFNGNDILIGSASNTNEGEIGDDRIDGGSGDDTIEGNGGADTLIGGYGNDVIDSNTTSFINSIMTSITDSIGDLLDGGVGDDSLMGDSGDDTMLGVAGNDTIRGGFGNDSIDGGTGNDRIFGNNSNDTLIGSGGNDILNGGNGNNYLDGGKGNDNLVGGDNFDVLVGGAGNDTLTGGASQDHFEFQALGTGIDTITDYSVIQDTITIDANGFGGGLSAGGLSKYQFVIGTSATTKIHRFVYDDTTGNLFFDVDGTGSLAQKQIANFSDAVALTHNEFVIV